MKYSENIWIFQFFNKTLSVHFMNLNNKKEYKLFNALLMNYNNIRNTKSVIQCFIKKL